jgi:hypothetical protein
MPDESLSSLDSLIPFRSDCRQFVPHYTHLRSTNTQCGLQYANYQHNTVFNTPTINTPIFVTTQTHCHQHNVQLIDTFTHNTSTHTATQSSTRQHINILNKREFISTISDFGVSQSCLIQICFSMNFRVVSSGFGTTDRLSKLFVMVQKKLILLTAKLEAKSSICHPILASEYFGPPKLQKI